MSNNNSRNVYYSTRSVSSRNNGDDEMANLLDQSQTRGGETTINIDNDIGPSTSQQRHYQPLHLTIRRESNPTARINMESNIESPGTSSGLGEGGEAFVGSNNSGDGTNQNIDEMQPLRNLFSMLRDARQQFHRQQSAVSSRDHRPSAGNDMAPVNENIPSGSGAQSRSWRENLYEVFSSPVTPRTDVLRAIFTPSPSGNFRYNSLPTNDTQAPEDHIHLLLNSNSLDQDIQTNNQLHRNSQTDVGGVDASQSTNNPGLRLYRQNSRLSERSVSGADSASSPGSSSPAATTDVDAGSRRQSNGGGSTPSATNGSQLPPQRQVSVAGSTAAPTIEMDDPDTNAMGEIFVKIVSHFVRYLPFICILLVKFIHDHLLGILDLIILQGVMYQVNKSLKEQVAKLNQKSFGVLVRDTAMVICIVSYRFVMANSMPDPFGLLINPPGEKLILDLSFSSSSHEKTDQNAEATLNPLHALNQIISKHDAGELPSEPTSNPLNNDTLSLAKSASLGVLLYYIAVNDLIIKLLTQLVKIIVTMLPTKVIRPKSRGRLYALIEYTSHFYRALAPMRQWLTFWFESYTGLEIISGILFSSFYFGAKAFEFKERTFRNLRKALVNFVRNMDYDRKPTKDELGAAGSMCPICHDVYTTPVVLECGHIFCDDCVNTWFKREQTCPMCRAKVSEDPTWQDGATTFFYQMF